MRKNALLTYFKLILNVLLGLISVRYLLIGLGNEAFGLYALISSIIVSVAFFNSAMTLSSQRFLSYSIGESNIAKVSSYFSCSIFSNFVLSIFLLALMLMSKEILFSRVLSIPSELIGQAETAYYLSSLVIFFVCNSVALNALIISYNDIWILSIVEMLNLILRFLVIIALTYFNRLDVVGMILAICLIEFVVFLVKLVIIYLRYRDVNVSISFVSKEKVLELSKFIGWNSFGSLSGVLKNHGTNIAINSLFGLSINASFSLANQISGKIKDVPHTLGRIFSPNIMRLEGEGRRSEMYMYSIFSTKVCIWVFSITSIFFLTLLEPLIELWLDDVPSNVINISYLFMILFAVNMMTIGYQSAIQAIGDIKAYQIIVGGLNILALPLGILMVVQWRHVELMIISLIITELIASYFRVTLVTKHLPSVSKPKYLIKVLLLYISVAVYVFLVLNNLEGGVISTISTNVIFSTLVSYVFYYIIFIPQERKMFSDTFMKRIRRYGL